MTPEALVNRVLKPATFVVCLVPFVLLAWGAWNDALGANPVETITRDTGRWALRLLLMTLAVTPLRQLTGFHLLMRLRRMLGLFCFFYALLHFTTYAVLDSSLDPAYILDDIIKRPYITVGFTAFCLLLPLAATSTNAMVRRLGGRRWRNLHRFVYVIGALVVLHFLWLVKADLRDPLLYASIYASLMLTRVPMVARRLPTLRAVWRGLPVAGVR